jgi:protein arginine N-methyltransferase 1
MSSYSIVDFGRMVLDDARRQAYLGALRSHIDETTRVLDLGCGTGFFTIAALHAGAHQVTAIDLAEAVRVVPEICRSNGYADRASVWLGDVRKLETGPFDLIIADLRGSVPLYGAHLEVIADATSRLLAPGGVLLPRRDDLRLALAVHDDWRLALDRQRDVFPGDWSPALDIIARTPVHQQLGAEVLRSTEATWDAIDYHDMDSLHRRSFGADVEVEASATTMLDGIAVWFDAQIDEQHSFTTRPSAHEPAYRRMFLPIGDRLAVEAGERVAVQIRAFRMSSGWAWKWGVQSRAGQRHLSTLDQLPLTKPSITVSSPDGAPILLATEVPTE